MRLAKARETTVKDQEMKNMITARNKKKATAEYVSGTCAKKTHAKKCMQAQKRHLVAT